MQYPALFKSRMRALLGDDWADFAAAGDAPLRRGLRVNTLKLPSADFAALFEHPLSPSPFACDAFYLDGECKAGAHPLHHAGAMYMQEPSAASAVTVLAPRKGEWVLDLCAAPGGKSTQIAAAVGPDGLLWSNEYVRSRASILAQNIERLGVAHAVVSSSDTGPLCAALSGCFDAVLVDAPCSGEGMFRKEPEALAQWSLDNVTLCAARQDSILDNAAVAVRPGGRLVYSTCTFAPEENEAAVARFLARHPDFSLCDAGVSFGRPAFTAAQVAAVISDFACEADLTPCRRVLPQDGGEGHFIAAFVRLGDAPRAPLPVRSGRGKTVSDPHAAAAATLWADCFTDAPTGQFVTFGDTVRLLPAALPASLHAPGVVCAGVAAASVCRDRLEPAHAAFMAHHPSQCRRCITLSPDDARLTAFLRGEELVLPTEKARLQNGGWTAVAVGNDTCEGAVTGFGKAVLQGDTVRLKNRYPKGLRLLG